MSTTHQSPDELAEAHAHTDAEPPSQARRPKRLESEITVAIQNWATKIKSSRQSLLNVQLSQRGKLSPAYTYLLKELQTSGNTFNTREDILDSIIQRMIEENIVIPDHPSIANEWRRKLLCWYENLSETERQNTPVFGKTISSEASLYQVDGMKNLKQARANFPIVEQTFQEILLDLTRLGVINADYKNCKERAAEAGQKKQEATPKDSVTKALSELRLVGLSKFGDLVENSGRPFSKLLHMFAAASMKSKSSSGQQNYSEGFRQMAMHLTDVGFKGGEDPREYVTAHYLTRLRKYLVDQMESGTLTSNYASGVLSAVRSMLKRTVKIRGFGLTSFIDVQGFDTGRQTDVYRPYPKFARTAIQQACDMERRQTNELAKDYVAFHGGSDPLDENGHFVKGMATLENARWIFENKLNCRPISESSADTPNMYEQGFTRLVRIGGLGVTETYASWGVIYQVTSRTIAPYITRLAQVTGLNADSLKSLDIDDFVESHELTQRPYLRYWKERSGGGKVLHLDLMYADWTWLTRAQSIEVRKIFSEVIHLTRHIRERAEGPAIERLFIYESQKQSEFRKVKSFENSTVINNVMNQLARDHKLKTEGGEDLNISASRLRPSLVADLVEQGVSIREIQVILGHGSLKTTINYLDKLEFNKTAREVNSKALTKIHKGTIIQDAQPATRHKASAPGASSSPVIIRTSLVSCRDVLNPPDEITKLPSYKKGSKCSLLNKCLSCSNSIITVSNLPDLFAMQWDYVSIMSTSNVAETPYGTVIRENLEVLNSILTPYEHGFTAEQLEEARRLAEHIVTNPMIEAVSL
ncbi:hypothetical protein HA62_14840 [Pseudomonas putida]|nr:hypothetical protein HA62_14840 [Pseudomonas putida]